MTCNTASEKAVGILLDAKTREPETGFDLSFEWIQDLKLVPSSRVNLGQTLLALQQQ
ncbi:hypothetical protein [Salinisphaera sp. G21_0]|uniref:hypothetical protein n=1 Tax=Salinisphaera sp. G21_0 TaxID=2821094 RepID=UPI001ADAC32A|nr:hypothetical protein [Salinisphaera sp. G21_0]MBO9481294.1 hypothetical protein [Salinisphaera sp. G21_0]